MFVKICGITNEEDALLSLAVGADALGFNFVNGSKRKIATQELRDSPKVASRCVNSRNLSNDLPERVISVVNETGLMAAQLHGVETPENVKRIKQEVRTVFKAVSAGSQAFYNAEDFGADAILVDSETPGEGDVFDWQMAENGPTGVSLILAGGLTPQNVSEGIWKVRPWGVDMRREWNVRLELKTLFWLEISLKKQRKTSQYLQSLGDNGDESDTPYDWKEDPTWR